MGFPVYDMHQDIRNLLVTPEIRARFVRMEPGEASGSHSHDLGHEVFLILEGQCEFTIEGDTQVLGPGQMCVALVDQAHATRVVGDEPMIMYLSVTPHISPTHTSRGPSGEHLPHGFSPPSSYDLEPVADSVEANISRHVEAAGALSEAAGRSAAVQEEMGRKLGECVAGGDRDGAAAARKAMWDSLFTVFRAATEQAEHWNDLAPRADIRD